MKREITKTILHLKGYKKGRNCYYKTRIIAARPPRKATVQVQLRGHGWFDVTAIEGGVMNESSMLRGVQELRRWERFAFCQ